MQNIQTISELTFDWETTTHNTGSVYDKRNKAVCIGLKQNDLPTQCVFEWPDLQSQVDSCSLLIGFNLKYDLAWLRKEGVSFAGKPLWDCQVAEFLLSGQATRFPSLEDTSVKYGLGHKIDVIKNEYWSKNIQTDEIPRDILGEYCAQDVELTYKVYQKQKPQFESNPQLYQLFRMMMLDLVVLQEMEWNGIYFDSELCHKRNTEIEASLQKISSNLSRIYPDVPINFNSNDQLSAFLYGGTVKQEKKEIVGVYKTGARAGEPKFKNVEVLHTLPRLIEPLKGSEAKKEGVWKTDEGTLRKLKGAAAKTLVSQLLEHAKLEKLSSTYYKGLPEKNIEGFWPPNYIHGQYNQVVAGTGRLSSSKPNQQNFAGDILDIFVSRYN